MNRRAFLRALAALPIVGPLLAAETKRPYPMIEDLDAAELFDAEPPPYSIPRFINEYEGDPPVTQLADFTAFVEAEGPSWLPDPDAIINDVVQNTYTYHRLMRVKRDRKWYRRAWRWITRSAA